VGFSFIDVCAAMRVDPDKALPHVDLHDYREVQVMSPTGEAYPLAVIPTVDIIRLAEMANNDIGNYFVVWLGPNVFARPVPDTPQV